MNVVNYQKELDKLLQEIEKREEKPRLFLHSCCAPCSSYVLLYLAPYFELTVFYYNPNIGPGEEFQKRSEEQRRLIGMLNEEFGCGISFVEGAYEPARFLELSKGLEQAPEGGERCFRCYELRLREAACLAKKGGYDYFTTTLSISPLKNAAKLNEIGQQIGEQIGIAYLPSDFKKRDGYRQSVALSQKYGLYRQNYCGCVFSKQDSIKRLK
ncbi:MAG: epoxyqueuosine reductase QueH [Lachnospiraceae bacterium]